MKRWFVLHPFLFALFPVLFLFAQNVGEMKVIDLIGPILVVLIFVIIACLLLRLILRSTAKAGLMVSFFLILFFTFGHLVELVKKCDSIISFFGTSPNRLLLTVIGVSLLSLFIFLLWTKLDFRKMTTVLNTVGTVLVVIQIVTGGYTLVTRSPVVIERDVVISPRGEFDDRPDIYYIILDGYARHDILNELFNYDNSMFLEHLRDRGFYVADSSWANYCQTLLSLGSTLNMNYIDQLGEFDTSSSDRIPLTNLLETNVVFDFLRQQGYKIITFATGYEFTEIENSDIYLKRPYDVSEFANLLLSTTPLPLLFRRSTSPFILHRERVLFALDRLAQMRPSTTPCMVFAHIVSPHPPFLYDENGAEHQRSFRFSFADGDHYTDIGGTTEEYVAGYRNQIRTISQKVLTTLDTILEHYGDTPPIIIVQGDHGSGLRLCWNSLKKSDVKERMAILNVYFLPGLDSLPTYADITPVNTFRMIINQYFDGKYEMLPDKSYFSTWERPYDFIDVTVGIRAGKLRGETDEAIDSIGVAP